MVDYIKYKRKATDDKEKNISIAASILKRHLRKGDILIIKPNLTNIKVKLFNPSTYFISFFSKGITHSGIYDGKGNVYDVEFRWGKHLRKRTLRELLRVKYQLFKGITVYAVQPKKYSRENRYDVDRFITDIIKAGKDINFSINQFIYMLYLGFIKDTNYKNAHKIKQKFNEKKAVCSTFVAHVLKKSGINLGRRPVVTFLPSTFIFSRNFRIKKKVRI
ncbi:hypothetical protein J4414_01235 [Candidatus Woesearchaeota archaeon]|nr:hypothetical protein [Candidatus Woesearchaeota archaeon]